MGSWHLTMYSIFLARPCWPQTSSPSCPKTTSILYSRVHHRLVCYGMWSFLPEGQETETGVWDPHLWKQKDIPDVNQPCFSASWHVNLDLILNLTKQFNEKEEQHCWLKIPYSQVPPVRFLLHMHVCLYSSNSSYIWLQVKIKSIVATIIPSFKSWKYVKAFNSELCLQHTPSLDITSEYVCCK